MAFDSLCTLTQIKQWLKVTGAGDDAAISAVIQPASELIGRYCGRNNLGNVYTYTENYSKNSSITLNTRNSFSIVLRHYPVTTVTSVTFQNTVYTVPLTTAQLQTGASGFYLEEEDNGEPRVLKFVGGAPTWPVTVVYSAGYAPNAIPTPLQQAAIQFAAEIYRSQEWVMKQNVSVAGEVVSMDKGSAWGMSQRVKLLLSPYKDVNPFRMFG